MITRALLIYIAALLTIGFVYDVWFIFFYAPGMGEMM